MHRVSRIVSSELSLDEMLGEIVGLASQVTDATPAWFIWSRKHGRVRAAGLAGAARWLNWARLRIKMGEGVTGWVAEHQAPVALSTTPARDPRFKIFPTLIEDTYEAFLSVPLVNKGKVIGVINVHHRDEHDALAA